MPSGSLRHSTGTSKHALSLGDFCRGVASLAYTSPSLAGILLRGSRNPSGDTFC